MMNSWKASIGLGGLLQHCRRWWCSVIPGHQTDQHDDLPEMMSGKVEKGPADQAVLIHFAWNDLFKNNLLLLFSCSVMSDSETLWTAKRQASLSFTISWSLLKLMSIESLIPSNHLILCRPLLLLPCIFPSIRVFSSELALHIRWPKWWSFSFSISPSNEYSELISFRINWFDLLAVQGILRSLLQYHSSKASFFGTQPSLWSNSHIPTWLLEKP